MHMLISVPYAIDMAQARYFMRERRRFDDMIHLLICYIFFFLLFHFFFHLH